MSEYTPPPPPPSQPSGWGSGPGGPEGPTGPGGPGGAGGPVGQPAKGFFGALFDFSFEHFVTPSIVKVVYVLATIALALGFVGFLISAFVSGSSGLIVLTLILGPVLALLYLALRSSSRSRLAHSSVVARRNSPRKPQTNRCPAPVARLTMTGGGRSPYPRSHE